MSYFVRNSTHFAGMISEQRIAETALRVSFNVKSLFTNVPVGEARTIIKQHLEQDTELDSQTTLREDKVVELVEFCLTMAYFQYGGKFNQQQDGVSMGSSLSSIVANIYMYMYMEAFEKAAIKTATHTPNLWVQCVDNTYVYWDSY